MSDAQTLNAVCPYYTMYPLDFPLRVLKRGARVGQWVLDPFCGRGTTNFAARLLGLPSIGIDSSPIAVAISEAKMSRTSERCVLNSANSILESDDNVELPVGEFWRYCYHKETLKQICRFRKALMLDCRSDARKVLRAILLGALHGPLTKIQASHLSNQSPRTFAPKPRYAVKFWKDRKLRPPKVDIIEVIENRAKRYLETVPQRVDGEIRRGDSRNRNLYPCEKFSWIVTSPPYFGMRTYLPDQWIRYWFLGGPSEIDYTQPDSELSHGSQEEFASQLRKVWRNASRTCCDNAKLAIRFGGINDRKCNPIVLLKDSLSESGWRITTIKSAGDSDKGKRQAHQFGTTTSKPMLEYDVYARRE